jgi:hypothetical protein
MTGKGIQTQTMKSIYDEIAGNLLKIGKQMKMKFMRK